MQVKAVPQSKISLGKAVILVIMALCFGSSHAYATFTDPCADGSIDKQYQQALTAGAQAKTNVNHNAFSLVPATNLGQLPSIQGLMSKMDDLTMLVDAVSMGGGAAVQGLVSGAVQGAMDSIASDIASALQKQFASLLGSGGTLAQLMNMAQQASLAGGLSGVSSISDPTPMAPFGYFNLLPVGSASGAGTGQ